MRRPDGRRRRQTLPGAVRRPRSMSRCGATTLDYVLLMTALLPFVALSLSPIRRIISLVYELTCVLVASPFL